MVRKNEHECRVCGDYCRLNAATVSDRYPLPRLSDFSVILRGTKIFSKTDPYMIYQIPIAPIDIPKTDVITPPRLLEYTKMTFGLRNVSQTFERYNHQAVGNLDFVFAYIDDILITPSNHEEHKSHLKFVS